MSSNFQSRLWSLFFRKKKLSAFQIWEVRTGIRRKIGEELCFWGDKINFPRPALTPKEARCSLGEILVYMGTR
jgi:hypothetical protein